MTQQKGTGRRTLESGVVCDMHQKQAKKRQKHAKTGQKTIKTKRGVSQ